MDRRAFLVGGTFAAAGAQAGEVWSLIPRGLT